MVNCPRCGSSRIYKNDDSPKFEWKCHMCKCEFNYSTSGGIGFDDINNIIKNASKSRATGSAEAKQHSTSRNKSHINVLIRLAKEYFNKKEYDKSYENIIKVIQIENDNESAWIIVTEIFIALNKYEDAHSSIMTLMNINHKNPKVWHLKSKVFLSQQRYEEALSASNECLKLDNNQTEKYIRFNQNITDFLRYQSGINNSDEKSFIFYPSNEVDLSTVISGKNIDLFKDKKIIHEVYYGLIDNFINETIANYNYKEKSGIYDKIKAFSSLFAKVEYKNEGEFLGLYAFNKIRIDSRYNKTFQIAAFIHELAHHLLAEILELSLMYIFDSVKTDAIETFIAYLLGFEETYSLMNEYCAHTVENYFMPNRYKSFGSFRRLLKNFNLSNEEDLEKVRYATELGNTFAQDIIYMLNKFFDEKLSTEIKKQYLDDIGIYFRFDENKFATEEILDEDIKLKKINLMFLETLVHIKTNNSLGILMMIMNEFKTINKT